MKPHNPVHLTKRGESLVDLEIQTMLTVPFRELSDKFEKTEQKYPFVHFKIEGRV